MYWTLLARSLRQGVELRGQLLEERGPVTVSSLSFLFAETYDDQVLLGSHVDVLPEVATSGEVVFAIRCVYPPEVLVVRGGVNGRVRARGLLNPPPGDELLTLPFALLGEQHAEPREVARSCVHPAFHLLEAA